MTRLIDARAVTLVRGGRRLFDRLDLSLAAGEALHLTGPNGCGKSSLIRLVAGLLRPAAGSIERAEAAMADDALALDRDRPLGAALAWWGGRHIGQAMTQFGLDLLADVPVRMLSTGQARRARLARVMASGAPLWLLDEPLNGLDRDGVERLDGAIAGPRAIGGAVLAASPVAIGGDWRMMALGG